LCGFSEKLIRNLLERVADKETQSNIESSKYRKVGITGVPKCIIYDDFVIPGAHTEEFWINILNEI